MLVCWKPESMGFLFKFLASEIKAQKENDKNKLNDKNNNNSGGTPRGRDRKRMSFASSALTSSFRSSAYQELRKTRNQLPEPDYDIPMIVLDEDDDDLTYETQIDD